MNAGKLLRLATPNYISSQAEHLRPGVSETLNVLKGVADTFNGDLASTNADKHLSAMGQSRGRRRVAAAALARLNTVETTTIKNLSDRAVTLEKALLGKASFALPSDPAERLSFELRLQEIRSQLRELPPADRLNVYLTTSDPMTLAAIENAPMTLSQKRPDGSRRLEPFVDPEQRTLAALERARSADPEAAKTLDEVRSLREMYQMAVNGLRREILDEVPAGRPDSEPVVF